MAVKIALAPALAARTMRGWVLMTAGRDGLHAALLALSLKAIVLASVLTERFDRKRILAPRAPLLTFGRAPSGMRGIPRFRLSDLALPAIARQAIRPARRFVELIGFLERKALGAGLLFDHVSLPSLT
jgi:hypothetical protein